MDQDLNKTELTKKVTALAVSYLDGRGFKPIETEVAVSAGWVADIASVILPTNTELINLGIISRAPRGLTSVQKKEWECKARVARRAMTAIVEVKTSRSDFLGDKKWSIIPPSDLSYIATVRGIIRDGEAPQGWGILEVVGESIRLTRHPEVRNSPVDLQLSIVIATAIRRDHNTRYRRLRELRREDRERSAEHTNVVRVSTALRAILAILKKERGSVDEVLSYYGITTIPSYCRQELYDLWEDSSRSER